MGEARLPLIILSEFPKPPLISIESKSHQKIRDQNSFKELKAESLKDYSWEEHKNIRELSIELNNPDVGFIGTAIVAILESRGMPTDQISITTKSVRIDHENYDLEKSIRLGGKEISLRTTSITIDEDGGIDSSDSSSRLAHSKSRISLHGIEIPSSLFPDPWSMQKNQVRLEWPFPILLVVDICGDMDLDLNSSRTQILMSEKWVNFESSLSYEILSRISRSVKKKYWDTLKGILLKQSENKLFLDSLRRITL